MSSGKKTTVVTDEKNNNTDLFSKWLESIYDTDAISEDFLNQMKENFEYKGFNQIEVLKNLYKLINDPKVVIQIIVVGALRGPVAGSKVRLLNGKTVTELGIQPNGSRGNNKQLTMGKIVASTADLAAWYLKQMNVKPRIKSDLPAWLQFPSAGSIKMPERYRLLHKEFSIEFSKKIGGGFNEDIYNQMEANQYLNEKLRFFLHKNPLFYKQSFFIYQ